VRLLAPTIRVKAKDKLGGPESTPSDFNSLKQKVAEFESDGEQNEKFKALMQWMINFLVHS